MSDPNLAARLMVLIRRNVSAACDAADRLRRELAVTDLLTAVESGTVSRRGTLADGTHYRFHGVGCAVDGPRVCVDFDFGPGGRTDGFDAWRLHLFAEQFPDERDFHDEALVAATLADMQRAGMVTAPRWAPSSHLRYLAKLAEA
jgi:hypothetical protein